ncbi:hypothetical protein KVR01_007681 [Diaporthe batatas]|uniref:uncharacterized protein n=1 Tax=Diaporthe batatas TaxID=748121 RepID=UPI001D04078C|nr:uncharacterized protein KVR01_007681 [Diaporthe batatas]KAG8161916.1 hypothetical protein KVR01_007681 [Diaporthe batatas]
MDPAADKALSVNEVWLKLNDNYRGHVGKFLARYRGPDANKHFQDLVRKAYSQQLRAEAAPHPFATGKRKIDTVDADAADTQPDVKKPKASEVPAPQQAKGIDLASPKFPHGWPTAQQTPVQFGQPTLTAATAPRPTQRIRMLAS